MRALIQRVTHAEVSATEHETQKIGKGFVVLLGVSGNDTEKEAEKLWQKILKLRIFEDEIGKTNLALRDVRGEVLIVSQFTLFASCKKGNRPSFTQAGDPDKAQVLYHYFISCAQNDGITVKTGWFGEHMRIGLTNDGPFTIWLDTDSL